jgi:LacI family repressor for deo operon, udp, cdd, tsx, nupC, and nupG
MPASGSRGARPSVTIRDVARRAGVSTATVSRALANPDRVADATREAVVSAIAETGFTPNASARSLRARSTKMVLALLPGIGNSFYTPILNAVEEVLSLAGYGMIMGDTRMDHAREAHYDLLVRGGQVDGVMLLTGRLPHPAFAELDASVPITLICNDIPGIVGLPVIEIDNREAAHTIVKHLIDLGHTRIGHAIGPSDNVEAGYRLDGYRAALADAGLAADESTIWPGAFRFDAGVRVAEQFLAHPQPPTAMFMSNDEMAMGFIRTVRMRGGACPTTFPSSASTTLSSPAISTRRSPPCTSRAPNSAASPPRTSSRA